MLRRCKVGNGTKEYCYIFGDAEECSKVDEKFAFKILPYLYVRNNETEDYRRFVPRVTETEPPVDGNDSYAKVINGLMVNYYDTDIGTGVETKVNCGDLMKWNTGIYDGRNYCLRIGNRYSIKGIADDGKNYIVEGFYTDDVPKGDTIKAGLPKEDPYLKVFSENGKRYFSPNYYPDAPKSAHTTIMLLRCTDC